MNLIGDVSVGNEAPFPRHLQEALWVWVQTVAGQLIRGPDQQQTTEIAVFPVLLALVGSMHTLIKTILQCALMKAGMLYRMGL
jgi:hypothetical protein